jgi:hypothetical protein
MFCQNVLCVSVLPTNCRKNALGKHFDGSKIIKQKIFDFQNRQT